jgi:hypothetical protein
MFDDYRRDRDLKNFNSSYTLPNNLLANHPGMLAPLQAFLRRQRSTASGLDIVTTKNPISIKNSNAKNVFQKFGGLRRKLQ